MSRSTTPKLAMNKDWEKRLVEREKIQEKLLKAEFFHKTLNEPVDQLELSVRSANILANTEMRYVWQLAQKTDHQLLKIKYLSRTRLNEIRACLADKGLSLGMKIMKTKKGVWKTIKETKIPCLMDMSRDELLRSVSLSLEREAALKKVIYGLQAYIENSSLRVKKMCQDGLSEGEIPKLPTWKSIVPKF